MNLQYINKQYAEVPEIINVCNVPGIYTVRTALAFF